MIEALTWVIAGCGIALVVMLLLLIAKANNDRKLSKHRSKEASVADLLNYAAEVDDGIIVGKDGSFMAAWLYTGDDKDSSTEQDRESVSARINQALSVLGNGWMIHVDAVRRPAPTYAERGLSAFPDAITAAIDEERRRQFEGLGTMYEGYFVLTVTYLPPLLNERKFIELMFEDDAEAPNNKSHTRALLGHFTRECHNIEMRLSSALTLTRLKGNKMVTESGATVTQDDFLRWLHYCITGINQPIQLPTNPMYLDCLIGGQELWTGVIPKIGRHYIQVVALGGFPLESTPGMLTVLGELPIEYRWSSRFIFMEPHEALKHLEVFRKKWKQKVRGFFDQVFNTHAGPIDQDALAMVGDAEAALAEVNSGVVAQGYYTSVVILMNEDRQVVQDCARRVEKAINATGFTARIETINTMDAYLGSLPGHGVENVRRPLINTMNLADLLPTSTIWTGRVDAPCPMYPPLAPALMHCVTQGSTTFRLNLHVNDLAHSVVFGRTGSGKSTFLALIAAQLRRYPNMTLYAFDKGLSLYPLTAAIRASTQGVSGQHFTVAGDDDKLAFCPLQFLDTRADRAWAMEWINTILALNGLVTTAAQRNDIASAIVNMEKNQAYTLSEFSVTVQDEQIRETIKNYTVDGAMGHLLDAKTDGLSLSDFTVFEIEELMNLGDRYALPVLLYLFRRIERSLQGQPAAILLDEAWLMLGHPVFREKIREWLKVLRRANCFVLMATQSLTDAANSGIFDVIVESTATKLLLPNIYARDEDTAKLYKRLGLNTRQIEMLATAIPKRHYYYLSEVGRRLFDLAIGPLTMAFVGVSDKDSLALIRHLESIHGYGWVGEWLALKNLRLEDYQV
ncbi:MAG: VirB4 family type IV secretion/conjugal transfer ATPase [Methylococcaceae bacterium]|nr:VirB4 family type IV secretion/conjugal transfer ATPase [Methylococcaceae bacterium]